MELIRRAAEKPNCAGETLNIGNQDEEVSIGKLAELILQITGKSLEIKPLPASAGSPERRCPDMSKTLSLTGYRARVSLEEGLGRTFAWYKSRIFEGQELCEK
ncbi:MAG: hypothetical protein V1794_11990 [Candidatus Glassbacteria bacterium]